PLSSACVILLLKCGVVPGGVFEGGEGFGDVGGFDGGEKFGEGGFGGGVAGVMREVVPLVGIGLVIVEFFRAVAIANVAESVVAEAVVALAVGGEDGAAA